MPPVQAVQVEITLQDYFFENNNETEDRSHGDEKDWVTDSVRASVTNSATDSATDSATRSPISLETWERWFQTWLEQLQPEISDIPHYELSLRLSDDDEIQSLNAQYRQKDQPTDVLAFAALESAQPLPPEAIAELPIYLGDLVISVETAQKQAQDRGHSLAQELAWLATHGLLHLLGWDHPNEASLLRMLHQQENLLRAVGLSIQYD